MKEISLKNIDFDKVEKILEERAKSRQSTESFGRISEALCALKQMDIDDLAEDIRVNYEYTSGEIIIKAYTFSASVMDIFYLSKVELSILVQSVNPQNYAASNFSSRYLLYAAGGRPSGFDV